MEDTSKYLIHADVTADGVVERSDVVGAIFGQTEGLLGDELDLRDLRQSQKVGRIDVEITSTQGQSHGNVTIATSLDKVETATLAASLETITRVGPCRATLDVSEIEDVRAAKRKEVVDRAKELLRTGFDDSVMSSEEILTEVRQHVRVEDITEYDGFPAGPRVTDSDAIIVVEGRSDVLTLLKYGVKNAIAVEGTNVPDPIADLTTHRTVTAFLDGDRGGDLILEELSQVGDVDYVAFAPSGTSVEELDHHQLFAALRNKVPYDTVSGLNEPREAIAATDGSTSPAPAPGSDTGPGLNSESPVKSPRGTDTASNTTAEGTSHTSGPPSSAKAAGSQNTTENTLAEPTTATDPSTTEDDAETHGNADTASPPAPNAHARQSDSATADDQSLETVYEHATAIIRSDTDRVRFLDAENDIIAETDASSVGDELAELESEPESKSESVPTTIVLDGILSQQVLDLAADRGVERIIARSLGQFTKRPTSVQIHAVEDVASEPPE
ncbi:DNA primase DnaG [Natrialba aegyptia]|uniref:DNA primase DnaG n=1 Tax=Natrialba aegyptia DSM 13077 TaxID=1227491 RepID=M0B3G0_9EURY|nr:DNA primase DnaG [Natrialba aegyptia]ELZ04204.1 DNA primase [Natrialba aegyptia DSM 13077]